MGQRAPELGIHSGAEVRRPVLRSAYITTFPGSASPSRPGRARFSPAKIEANPGSVSPSERTPRSPSTNSDLLVELNNPYWGSEDLALAQGALAAVGAAGLALRFHLLGSSRPRTGRETQPCSGMRPAILGRAHASPTEKTPRRQERV